MSYFLAIPEPMRLVFGNVLHVLLAKACNNDIDQMSIAKSFEYEVSFETLIHNQCETKLEVCKGTKRPGSKEYKSL